MPPDGKMTHHRGLFGELRINRKQPRGEIVEIMCPAEQFANQNEKTLDQFFGGLLHVLGVTTRFGLILRRL